MKLGVLPALGDRAADPATAAAFARRLEDLGCESVWAVEHVVIPETITSRYPYDAGRPMSLLPGDDVPDPLHWLTFVAAVTTRLNLGTAMLILPEHNPVHLAKRLATLDVLSGGRLIAGVGVGWLREEYDAVGVPFERRGRRADEAIEAMRALWTQAPASYEGSTVRFAGVHSRPRPVRATGVPIVIGGHSEAAARRAARYGDGFYPLGVDLDGYRALLAVLRAECETTGRDPAAVELTARAPGRPAVLDALRDLGVTRVVVRAGPDDLEETVTRYRREVLGVS